MGFFQNLGRSVQATSRTTFQKTKELADIAKLNNQIVENNSRISQLYLEIGQKYYELHGMNPEPQLAKYVSGIAEMKAQNEAWNDQIQSLRGMTKCPNCGKIIPQNTIFCSGCGRRAIPDSVTVCQGCGAIVQKSMLFCSKCGTRIPEETQSGAVETQELRCESCGACLEEGTLFCPVCGHKVEQPEPVAVPAAEPTPADVQAPATETAAFETEPEKPEEQAPVLCAKCGQPLEEGAVFCANCGTPASENSQAGGVEERAPAVCPRCGNEIVENELFCSSCGFKVR